VLILVMLLFFLVFASNYSALDGGNWLAPVGLWGMLLSPIVFVIVVAIDFFRSID
jgi:hypothetical protein